MSAINKDSNAYTLGFLAVMVTLVALLLAFVSSALAPIITANEILDERTKILKSVIFVEESEEKSVFTEAFVNEEFETKIDQIVLNYQGDKVSDMMPSEVDIRKEKKKPIEERNLLLYIYTDDQGKQNYIFPLLGLGLWDEISGYVALEEDKRTIKGIAFDHKGETPGLGAEIVKTWFRSQFIGKPFIQDDGSYTFTVYKAGKYDEAKMGPSGVDGVSGATLTTNGVGNMMEEAYVAYQNFLLES